MIEEPEQNLVTHEIRVIVCDAAAHTNETDAHHTEGQYEERGGHHPEMDLAPEFVHAATGRFRVPVIQRGKEREDKAAEDRVMEVTDHKIRIGQVQVHGNGGMWRSGKTA